MGGGHIKGMKDHPTKGVPRIWGHIKGIKDCGFLVYGGHIKGIGSLYMGRGGTYK